MRVAPTKIASAGCSYKDRECGLLLQRSRAQLAPTKRIVKLLLNQHFSGCGELACGEGVEIETGGDFFADLVSAVPVCCASSTPIESGGSMP